MRTNNKGYVTLRMLRSESHCFHREVIPGQVYQYQVQAEAGGELGEASPPLSHIHGGPYCGDGKVER